MTHIRVMCLHLTEKSRMFKEVFLHRWTNAQRDLRTGGNIQHDLMKVNIARILFLVPFIGYGKNSFCLHMIRTVNVRIERHKVRIMHEKTIFGVNEKKNGAI